MWETREIVQKMTWTLLKKRYSKKRKQQENKMLIKNCIGTSCGKLGRLYKK